MTPTPEPKPPSLIERDLRAALSYRPSNSARRTGATRLLGTLASDIQVARRTAGDTATPSVVGVRGKVLVIYASQGWCPGFQNRGFPITRALKARYAERKVEFFYVQSPFEGHAVNDFARLEQEKLEWGITRPMAQDSVDEHGIPSTIRQFRTSGTPWHIVIDPGGLIRYNNFTRDEALYVALIDGLLHGIPSGEP